MTGYAKITLFYAYHVERSAAMTELLSVYYKVNDTGEEP